MPLSLLYALRLRLHSSSRCLWCASRLRGTKRPPKRSASGRPFSTIARNDQLVWCAVVFLIFSVAQTLMGGGLSVTYLYFEFGYNGLLSIFSILGNVAGAVLMLVFAALSGRFTRAQLMKAGALALRRDTSASCSPACSSRRGDGRSSSRCSP